MQKCLISCLILLICVRAYAEEEPRHWANHTIFGINKLAPHATAFHFDSLDAAKTGVVEQSPWYLSLNGDWKFKWVSKPADAPVGFEVPDFDDSEWNTIPVIQVADFFAPRFSARIASGRIALTHCFCRPNADAYCISDCSPKPAPIFSESILKNACCAAGKLSD